MNRGPIRRRAGDSVRLLLRRRFMMLSRTVSMLAFYVLAALPAAAQPPAPPAAPPPPPPLWDAQVGASFVGTTGNSETSSTGADFNAHRRGFARQIDSSAPAVRTSSTDPVTGLH